MKIFGLILLLLTGQVSLAQETLRIDNASREYDVLIRVQACGAEAHEKNPNTCNGPAQVSLYKKGDRLPFQILRLKNIEFYKDTLAYNPALNKNPRLLYEEEYGVVFDDFDFDGKQDLAICNGRNGGYAGPSYNIYLFDKSSNRFVENRRLSKLNEGVYLSLFFPDAKKKLLTTFSKSGCCYHETEKYRVVRKKPVLVEKIIEDAMSGDGNVLITTKKLVNGKWVKRVTKEKIDQQ
jgi:hypothetical protein